MQPIPLIFLGLCAFLLGFWLVRTLERRRFGSSRSQAAIAPAIPATLRSPQTFQETWQPSSALDQDLRHLISQHRKLEAIKLVREQSGWSLKQAKNYVEQRQERRSANSLDPEVVRAAQQLLGENRKIAAIQLIRTHSGWGLKEAKDYVEKL